MKVRYLIDELLVDNASGGLTWKPVGVWAMEVGVSTLSFDWKYLPGNPEREAEADRIATALVESGVQQLPDEFLEYHKDAYNSYTGQFYGPFDAECVNLPECCNDILAKIETGEIGQ